MSNAWAVGDGVGECTNTCSLRTLAVGGFYSMDAQVMKSDDQALPILLIAFVS